MLVSSGEKNKLQETKGFLPTNRKDLSRFTEKGLCLGRFLGITG